MTTRLLDFSVDGPRTANGDGRGLSAAIGVVSSNKDPDGMGRVQVRLPSLSDTHVSFWAPVAAPMAANASGVYFLPNPGEVVVVVFEHGDMRFPIVIGAMWNGADKPPADNADGKNTVSVIKSRRGHIIRLNDKEGAETIEIIDRGGNSVVIDTAKNTVTISAQDIVLSAKGTLRMKAGKIEADATDDSHVAVSKGKLNVTATDNLTLHGKQIDIN